MCGGCRRGLIPGDSDTHELEALVAAVDAEGDMRSLRGSAAAAARTSTRLAARQSDALEEVTSELLCSPEIVRCAAGPSPAPTLFVGRVLVEKMSALR